MLAAIPFHRLSAFAKLSADADAFTFIDGEWVESLGDAPFYGLGFYAHNEGANAAWSARAEDARARALRLITNADFFNGDLQQMVMSALGLIDYIGATGNRAGTRPTRASPGRRSSTATSTSTRGTGATTSLATGTPVPISIRTSP